MLEYRLPGYLAAITWELLIAGEQFANRMDTEWS